MQTKQELKSILSTSNLWPSSHLPLSTGKAFDKFHSFVTYDTVRLLSGILSSGLYDADIYINLEHPRSPLVIVRSPIFEENPPGSGVLAHSRTPHEPMNLLRFYSGRHENWHGCAEKESNLREKVNSGRWIYSGQLT